MNQTFRYLFEVRDGCFHVIDYFFESISKYFVGIAMDIVLKCFCYKLMNATILPHYQKAF